MRDMKHAMKRSTRALLTGLAFLLFTGGALAACDRDDKAEQVAESPTDYLNQRVSVTAEVEDIRNARAFTLEGDAVFGDILVLVPRGVEVASLSEDTKLTVTGTVRQFNASELERDFDFDYNLDATLNYETSQPVIVADGVTL